jgi:hypothetical protein
MANVNTKAHVLVRDVFQCRYCAKHLYLSQAVKILDQHRGVARDAAPGGANSILLRVIGVCDRAAVPGILPRRGANTIVLHTKVSTQVIAGGFLSRMLPRELHILFFTQPEAFAHLQVNSILIIRGVQGVKPRQGARFTLVDRAGEVDILSAIEAGFFVHGVKTGTGARLDVRQHAANRPGISEGVNGLGTLESLGGHADIRLVDIRQIDRVAARL